tara:strand:- start:868 stop:990 length:123 start_codon:yes stop_codon:yes gene_type:complete
MEKPSVSKDAIPFDSVCSVWSSAGVNVLETPLLESIILAD